VKTRTSTCLAVITGIDTVTIGYSN